MLAEVGRGALIAAIDDDGMGRLAAIRAATRGALEEATRARDMVVRDLRFQKQ